MRSKCGGKWLSRSSQSRVLDTSNGTLTATRGTAQQAAAMQRRLHPNFATLVKFRELRTKIDILIIMEPIAGAVWLET